MCLLQTYISNSYNSQIAYVDNKLYKMSDDRTFNNTHTMSKHIHQYTTDVVNNSEVNTVSNLKQTSIL